MSEINFSAAICFGKTVFGEKENESGENSRESTVIVADKQLEFLFRFLTGRHHHRDAERARRAETHPEAIQGLLRRNFLIISSREGCEFNPSPQKRHAFSRRSLIFPKDYTETGIDEF